MARLLVEACTSEQTAGDVLQRLELGVSVSRENTGAPVTGLNVGNFRVAELTQGGVGVVDFQVSTAFESKWEPDDAQLSGCYALMIRFEPPRDFSRTFRYVFGIQARTFTGNPPRVVDQGQTILDIVSLGR